MSSPVDHVAAMKALLPAEFYTQTNLLVWMRALGNHLNLLDSTANDMLTLMPLTTATGVQLDGWGRILNQGRGGLSDTDYRVLLLGVAAGYTSKGTPPQLIALFFKLVGGSLVEYAEPATAEFWLSVTGPAPVASYAAIRAIMNAARPAGVTMNLTYGPSPAFAFNEDPDPNTAGFADLAVPGSGGTFVTLF